MNPRKIIIILGVIVGILVVLAGGASLLVKYLVTPEMIRKIVLPRMEAAIQRPIEFKDAKIGIFSGIALRGLTVYERNGKEPFLSVKDARLRFELLSLLSRRIVVDKIVLISPHIHVVRYSDGTFNFTDLIGKEKLWAAEQQGLSFAVAALTVTDGSMAYEDQAGFFGTPFSYQVRGADMVAKGLRPDQPFPAKLKECKIRLKEAKLIAAGYAARLSGAFTLSDGRLNSRDFSVTVGKNRLAILMTTSSLGKKPLRVQLSARTNFLDLDVLRPTRRSGAKALSSPTHAGGTKTPPLGIPVEITGTFHAGTVILRGLAISKLSIRYVIADNILSVEDLRGGLTGGTFTDTARINLAARGFPFTTRLNLHGIRSDTLSAKADLTGSGRTFAAIKRSLSGTGDFHILNGKVSSCGFVLELARVLHSEELRVIHFRTFNGTFRIRGEQVFLSAFLDGPAIRMKQTGRIGFDNSLDMNIEAQPASHVTIPIKATGSIASPNCSISGKNLERQIGEKGEETKELGKKVLKNAETGLKEKKQQLEKSLRGIFGR
jgi:hypothetical protein